MLPNNPPGSSPPPKGKGTIYAPILVNAALVLAFYGLTAPFYANSSDAAVASFVTMCVLAFLNMAGLIITAVAGQTRTAIGLGFSVLGIFLIGLSSCNDMVQLSVRH